MKRKILFLDFDGVLNSHQFHLMRERPEQTLACTIPQADFEFIIANLCPYNIWNLKFILTEVPDLEVVLSTSWRNHFDFETIKAGLEKFGIHGERIIGKTPRVKINSERNLEIRAWLEDLSEQPLWAAIDDMQVFPSDKDYFFKTDQMTGLTYRDACQVIEYFNPEWKRPVILL